MSREHLLFRDGSVLLHGAATSSRNEVHRSLPELGALVGGEAATCPALQTPRSLPLVLAVTRLVLVVATLHKQLAPKVRTDYNYLLIFTNLMSSLLLIA